MTATKLSRITIIGLVLNLIWFMRSSLSVLLLHQFLFSKCSVICQFGCALNVFIGPVWILYSMVPFQICSLVDVVPLHITASMVSRVRDSVFLLCFLLFKFQYVPEMIIWISWSPISNSSRHFIFLVLNYYIFCKAFPEHIKDVSMVGSGIPLDETLVSSFKLVHCVFGFIYYPCIVMRPFVFNSLKYFPLWSGSNLFSPDFNVRFSLLII